MIRYALVCDNDHRFEAWFRNAEAFDEQQSRGIVSCPLCASGNVGKAIMAPSVSRAADEKVSLAAGHPEHRRLREAMIALRRKVTSEADYVGDRFADEARKIHFKEVDPRGIYGEATREEAASLIEDGIEFLPLPQLPEEAN